MTLLPSNESQTLKGLDGALEGATKLNITGLNTLPQKARAELLPYLAHMLDVNIAGLSEGESRALMANAIEIHRYEGTLYAVKKALLSVFSRAEILEWFDSGGSPFTFSVKVVVGSSLEAVFDTKKFERCRALINAAKNARSKFLNFYVELPPSTGVIGVGTALNWKSSASGQTRLKERTALDLSMVWATTQSIKSQQDLRLQPRAGLNFTTTGGVMWLI